MSKSDREYELRMQGMIYAANIAKKDGIDALEKEMRKRNVLKAPLCYTDAQIDEFVKYICDNTRNTTFAITFNVLNEVFGFGEKRLVEFSNEFNKRFNDCVDLDYIGEHYVTLEDFAIDITSKYKNLVLDIQRIAVCQDEHDKGNPDYKNPKYVEGIVRLLMAAGYEDAATYLQETKLGGAGWEE